MNTDFIKISLFPHQQQSIIDMEKLEKNPIITINSENKIETHLGCLSDLPGYGKSLSILGLIGITRFDTDDDVYFKETVEISNLKIKTKSK